METSVCHAFAATEIIAASTNSTQLTHKCRVEIKNDVDKEDHIDDRVQHEQRNVV